MSSHTSAFMPLQTYFAEDPFQCKSNRDSNGHVHLFKAILQFLTGKISHRTLHRSMIPEMFSESLIELKKIAWRINHLSEVLVFAQKIKELVNPESRLYIYQHVLGVMYHHTELNPTTVSDICIVTMACSGFPVVHGYQLLETLMNQAKEDNNNVLAMAATLSSFVRKVVPKMKFYQSQARQKMLAEEISKKIVPSVDSLICYDLVVIAKILFDVINDNITSFCNLYHRELNPGMDQEDSVFLPVDFQSKLEAMAEEAVEPEEKCNAD